MLTAESLGARVKMSAKKLREQVLPDGANNIYIRVLIDGKLAGNVFGTRWVYEGEGKMLWITQLCVSSDFRNQGIAKKLLETLLQEERGFGILSSHPFAILAVLRVFGRGPDDVDLEMTKQQAREIMASCPVGYVREAKLRGELFEGKVTDGTISCADTDFWVDHEEPLEALKIVKEKGITWPLGELPDGHEFLVVVKAKANDHTREGLKSSEF
jgi:GNAT superfamily N-acetyltransferase